jgi:AraC-like DNA-binding protein
VTYREHPLPLLGAVLWEKGVSQAPAQSRILPDGCLDLLWDGRRLFVAGPDTTARWHESPAGTRYVALRFSGGLGPALLGVPANEVRDQSPDLADLWPAKKVRLLMDRVAADPAAGFQSWALERATTCETDPLGPRVVAMAAAGASVATMADRLSLGVRQLHRRCLPLFGYGPRRLARVLRFGQALAEARRGVALAQVAAHCGYADHAHLTREVRDLAGTTPTALLHE